nr:RNA-directed DNA polymerase, eukaryota [Tanacetum cinerariifolium]
MHSRYFVPFNSADSEDVEAQEVLAPMGRDRAKKKRSSSGARSKTSIAGDPSLVDALLSKFTMAATPFFTQRNESSSEYLRIKERELELKERKRQEQGELERPRIAQRFPSLILDDSCISDIDFSLSLTGKVKNITVMPNLYVILEKEGFQNLSLTYLGGLWVLIETASISAREKLLNHTGVGSWFSPLKPACNSFVTDERVFWISLESLPLKVWTRNTFVKVASKWGDLIEWEDLAEKSLFCSCKGNGSMGSFICNYSYESESSDDEQDAKDEGHILEIKSQQIMMLRGSMNQVKCMKCDDTREAVTLCNHTSCTPLKTTLVLSDDPCNLYDIMNKRKDSGDDLKYPHGFTPSVINMDKVNKKVKGLQVTRYVSMLILLQISLKGLSSKENFHRIIVFSKRVQTGGSILQLIDKFFKVGQTMGYNMEGCMRNTKVIIGSQGECNVVKLIFFLNIQGLGRKAKKWCVKELCMKHHVNFVSLQKTKMESMELVTIKTLWGNSSFDHALSSSLDLTENRMLWYYIFHLIDRRDGDCLIMGDFNEVRTEQERYGSVFNVQGANAFNSFIYLAILIDLPLDGHAYTWAHKTTNKMSKLDRFLVSKGLLALFSYILALCLDRNLLDNRPILIHKLSINYGPTPFRFFHSWFNLDGFDKLVKDTWKSLAIVDSNGMINLKKKLQALKIVIKQWTKDAKKSSYKAKISIQSKLSNIDKILDQSAVQKSKVRWAIKVMRKKFFQGIINSKRSQLAIRGILVDGEWIVDPLAVKNLERNVSNEEIKSAVWDCGTNKSPGHDGFTFEFFRRYWKLLEHNILAAVKEFFALVTNACFFSGIPIDSSLTLSRLFFADDVISVGKWDSLNIPTIVNVLKCFHLASAQKINFHKNKLMGIGTRPEEVDAAATTIGCLIFTTPFVHVGVKQWLVRDDDDDFDVEIVYETYTDFFLMKVHHDGFFTHKGEREYVLGNITFVELLDMHVFQSELLMALQKNLDIVQPKLGIDYYGEIDASVSSKGKEPDVEASGNEAKYFDPFKDLDDIPWQYAKLLMITNDGFVDEQNMIEDVDVDIQPFKDDMDRKEALVRRCDLIKSHVDVSEANLDVIDLDSISSDLEDKIDSERRKMLREEKEREENGKVKHKSPSGRILNGAKVARQKKKDKGRSVNGKRKRTYDVSKNKQGRIQSQPSVTQSQGPSEVGITQSQTTSLGTGSSQVAGPSAMSPQCAGSSQGDRSNQGVGSNEGA